MSSFATAKPVSISMVGLQNDQEDQDFRLREEKRKDDEIKRLAQERADKKQKDLEDSYKAIKAPTATGIRSLDDAAVSYLTQATELNGSLYIKKIKGGKLTAEELALQKKLQTLPEKIDLMYKAYVTDNTAYAEERKKDNIHPDRDYDLSVQQMQKGATAFLDKNGNPAIAIDKDGDGKPEYVTFDQNEGFSLKPKFIPKISIDKVVKGFADTVDTHKLVTDNNFVKKTKEGIPIDLATTAAKKAVVNDDGTPAQFAISHFYEQGTTDPSKITKQQLDGLTATLTDRFLNSKKSSDETDVDNAAITAAKAQKETARKNKAEEEKDKVDPVIVNVKDAAFIDDIADKGADGKTKNKVRSKDGVLPQGYSFPKGIKIDNLGGADSGLNGVTIKEVYLNKNGDLLFTASVLDEKASGEKSGTAESGYTYRYGEKYKQVVRIAGSTAAAKIAKEKGFSSKEELVEDIKRLNSSNSNVDEYGVPIK